MFLLTLLLLSFSAFSQACEPVISLQAGTGIVLKEGHQQEHSVNNVYLEMDRYCPNENIEVTLLVRSGTAILGEHVNAEEINKIVIPAGQIASYFNFAIIGDNEWNEDRNFIIQAINPSRGSIRISTVEYTIKNDDPQINIVLVSKVTEPKKDFLSLDLKVQLSMPAEQRITGEVEFREISATRGDDFIAPFGHGFEILPGETEFHFLPNTLVILPDSIKEKPETLRLFLNNIKNATPENQSTLLTINDPKTFAVKFSSDIKVISEGKVAITSLYNVTGTMESENDDGLYISKDLIPNYKHSVSGLPGPVVCSPGKIRFSIMPEDKDLNKIRMEFIESPYEIYPYGTHKMFMYISSLMKIHESEFITLQSPEIPSAYPAFDFTKIQTNLNGSWELNYVQNFSEGGEVLLREMTKITIEEEL